MRFTCDLESNRASIFIFLTYIFMWKILVNYFYSCCWMLLIFTLFSIDVHMIFSSMSKFLSIWLLELVAMRFLFLLSFFLLFGLALILYMIINITLVALFVGILVLVWCGYHLFIFSPFPPLLPLLRSVLVLLPLWSTWFPFLMAYVLQLLHLYISVIQRYGLKQHHLLPHMAM